MMPVTPEERDRLLELVVRAEAAKEKAQIAIARANQADGEVHRQLRSLRIRCQAPNDHNLDLATCDWSPPQAPQPRPQLADLMAPQGDA